MLAVAVLAAAAALGGATPAAALQAEYVALRVRDFRAAWALMSPGYRASCSRTAWRDALASSLSKLSHPERVEATFPTARFLSRDFALLDYKVVYGSSITSVKGDLFVRVKDRWYDAADRWTPCK